MREFIKDVGVFLCVVVLVGLLTWLLHPLIQRADRWRAGVDDHAARIAALEVMVRDHQRRLSDDR